MEYTARSLKLKDEQCGVGNALTKAETCARYLTDKHWAPIQGGRGRGVYHRQPHRSGMGFEVEVQFYLLFTVVFGVEVHFYTLFTVGLEVEVHFSMLFTMVFGVKVHFTRYTHWGVGGCPVRIRRPAVCPPVLPHSLATDLSSERAY